MNLMDLIIYLKDGSQQVILIDRLNSSGTNGNSFFIDNHKQGRFEIPLDSIDGFKIDCPSGMTYLLHESNMTKLVTAVAILSKHICGEIK